MSRHDILDYKEILLTNFISYADKVSKRITPISKDTLAAYIENITSIVNSLDIAEITSVAIALNKLRYHTWRFKVEKRLLACARNKKLNALLRLLVSHFTNIVYQQIQKKIKSNGAYLKFLEKNQQLVSSFITQIVKLEYNLESHVAISGQVAPFKQVILYLIDKFHQKLSTRSIVNLYYALYTRDANILLYNSPTQKVLTLDNKPERIFKSLMAGVIKDKIKLYQSHKNTKPKLQGCVESGHILNILFILKKSFNLDDLSGISLLVSDNKEQESKVTVKDQVLKLINGAARLSLLNTYLATNIIFKLFTQLNILWEEFDSEIRRKLLQAVNVCLLSQSDNLKNFSQLFILLSHLRFLNPYIKNITQHAEIIEEIRTELFRKFYFLAPQINLLTLGKIVLSLAKSNFTKKDLTNTQIIVTNNNNISITNMNMTLLDVINSRLCKMIILEHNRKTANFIADFLWSLQKMHYSWTDLKSKTQRWILSMVDKNHAYFTAQNVSDLWVGLTGIGTPKQTVIIRKYITQLNEALKIQDIYFSLTDQDLVNLVQALFELGIDWLFASNKHSVSLKDTISIQTLREFDSSCLSLGKALLTQIYNLRMTFTIPSSLKLLTSLASFHHSQSKQFPIDDTWLDLSKIIVPDRDNLSAADILSEIIHSTLKKLSTERSSVLGNENASFTVKLVGLLMQIRATPFLNNVKTLRVITRHKAFYTADQVAQVCWNLLNSGFFYKDWPHLWDWLVHQVMETNLFVKPNTFAQFCWCITMANVPFEKLNKTIINQRISKFLVGGLEYTPLALHQILLACYQYRFTTKKFISAYHQQLEKSNSSIRSIHPDQDIISDSLLKQLKPYQEIKISKGDIIKYIFPVNLLIEIKQSQLIHRIVVLFDNKHISKEGGIVDSRFDHILNKFGYHVIRVIKNKKDVHLSCCSPSPFPKKDLKIIQDICLSTHKPQCNLNLCYKKLTSIIRTICNSKRQHSTTFNKQNLVIWSSQQQQNQTKYKPSPGEPYVNVVAS